jgi:general secretion pathway protein G
MILKRWLAYWWLVLLVSSMAVFVTASSLRIVDLRITDAFYKMRALEIAVENFRRTKGSLPEESQAFEVLVAADQIDRLPLDPWGSPYVYSAEPTSQGFRIYSVGLDGRDDLRAGDDVTSKDKAYRCEDYEVNCLYIDEMVTFASLLIAALALLVGVARGVIVLIIGSDGGRCDALRGRVTSRSPCGRSHLSRESLSLS